MFQQQISLEQVLAYIRQANDIQTNEIIKTLTIHYSEVYPDWDVTFLSLPKNNPSERKELLHSALSFLDNNL